MGLHRPQEMHMRRSITSFEILGVRIGIDASWILLATLIAWSLATGVFPSLHKGLAPISYWGMAAFTVVGLGVSIILHELSHTLVARSLGIPITSITLFIFGGVADMAEEPNAPKSEMAMAIAGPLMSVVLGGAFLGLAALVVPSVSAEAYGVLHYLGVVNLTLAAFNMLPAFPLDGGRVLRAGLWMASGDLAASTRRAAHLGEGVGVGMMALGGLAALAGQVVGGLWWVVLGLFLRTVAKSYGQDVETRRMLAGVEVREVMTPDPITASAVMTLQDFVEERLYRFHHDLFPVVDGDRVVGTAGYKEVKAVPREAWPTTRLGDACTSAAEAPAVDAGADAAQALRQMQRAGAGRLLVMEGDRLVGVLALKDLMGRLRLEAELASPGVG
jgi:Zn-dependent protease